jgi:hypothetical protein
MQELFSLNNAIKRGIDRVRNVNWDVPVYVELELNKKGTIKEFCKAFNAQDEHVANLPMFVANMDDCVYTFPEGVSDEHEYFNKFVIGDIHAITGA